MSVNPVYFPISPVASRLMSPLFSSARFLDSTHVSFVFLFSLLAAAGCSSGRCEVPALLLEGAARLNEGKRQFLYFVFRGNGFNIYNFLSMRKNLTDFLISGMKK